VCLVCGVTLLKQDKKYGVLVIFEDSSFVFLQFQIHLIAEAIKVDKKFMLIDDSI
jgi:hypothetical protein